MQRCEKTKGANWRGLGGDFWLAHKVSFLCQTIHSRSLFNSFLLVVCANVNYQLVYKSGLTQESKRDCYKRACSEHRGVGGGRGDDEGEADEKREWGGMKSVCNQSAASLISTICVVILRLLRRLTSIYSMLSYQDVRRVENMLICRDEFERVEDSEKVEKSKILHDCWILSPGD